MLCNAHVYHTRVKFILSKLSQIIKSLSFRTLCRRGHIPLLDPPSSNIVSDGFSPKFRILDRTLYGDITQCRKLPVVQVQYMYMPEIAKAAGGKQCLFQDFARGGGEQTYNIIIMVGKIQWVFSSCAAMLVSVWWPYPVTPISPNPCPY